VDVERLGAVDPIWWAILAAVVLVAIGIALWVRSRRVRRSERLRQRFRSEYDRTAGTGPRREVEAELERRLARRREVDLTAVGSGDADAARAEVDGLLRSFVESPAGAARGMTQLVGRIAMARGYVAAEQGVLDLVSVDHPEQVAVLRRGLSALEQVEGDGRTEICRKVCLDARDLIERLLAEGRPGSEGEDLLVIDEPTDRAAASTSNAPHEGGSTRADPDRPVRDPRSAGGDAS
jgi:stage V sporulation protein SpoVS